MKNTGVKFKKEAGSSSFQDVIETLKRNCQVSTSSMQSTAWKAAFDDVVQGLQGCTSSEDVRNGGEK